MAPERLVSVSWFPNLQVADEESRKLEEAGLQPYVAGASQRLDEPAEVLVPESQVEEARALLKVEPDTEVESREQLDAAQSPDIFVCPECRSADTYAVPPYAFRVLVASVVLLAVTWMAGKAWIGAAGLVVAWVAATYLSRHSGHYRCRQCGREWKPQ